MAGGDGFGESSYDEPDWEIPALWWNQEADMFFTMTGADVDMLNDPNLQLLFDNGYFEQGLTPTERHDAREALAEYLAEEYDVSFEDAMDWEAYREWYAAL